MKSDEQTKKEKPKETPLPEESKLESKPVFGKPPNAFPKNRPFNNFNIRKVEFHGSRHRG